MSALLEVEALSTEFPTVGAGTGGRAGAGGNAAGRASVVDAVNLRIERGEVLALVGESGCGKSMTALSILRLVPKPGRIAGGEVRLEGRNIQELSVPEIRQVRGHEIAMIFQEPMTSLNPVTTVGNQVVEAIQLHESVTLADARERTRALFARVGIPDPEARLGAYPHQLSGGLMQRVMIAMALSTRPKLLIADEPTTALDVTIQAQILELLRELQRDLGMSILLITHDLGIVNELADRVAVMYAGRIVEQGTRLDILAGARHPYTRGLLRSMPSLASPDERLPEIPGSVPSPEQWPPGCRFAGRCEQVHDRCSQAVPGPTRLSDGHRAWCHAIASEEAP